MKQEIFWENSKGYFYQSTENWFELPFGEMSIEIPVDVMNELV